MLRKRGEEKQTANADEYSKHDKRRICRFGSYSLGWAITISVSVAALPSFDWPQEISWDRARSGNLLRPVRIYGHCNAFRVSLRKQR